jgi:hypothetical protein
MIYFGQRIVSSVQHCEESKVTVTAKIMCTSKSVETDSEGNVVRARVQFSPDYQDGRNKDWAAATPTLNLNMTLNGDAAGLFEQGDKITLTFEKTVDEPVMSTERPVSDNPFVEDEPAQSDEAQQEAADAAVEQNEEFKDMKEQNAKEEEQG